MRFTENIKTIVGHEPDRDKEYPVIHTVGHSGVTAIEYECANYGDHGIGQFLVKKGDNLYSVMTHRAVAEIYYFDN